MDFKVSMELVIHSASLIHGQPHAVYSVTATLTLVSNQTLSRYNVPFCVSILTIQSFDESQTDAPVIPFNVSCLTFCENENRTEVCRVKGYQVAGTPHTTYLPIIVIMHP